MSLGTTAQALTLAVIPLLLMPMQRIQLTDGQRIDPGHLAWLVIGALCTTASGLRGSEWALIAPLVLSSVALRVVLAAVGDQDNYTLVSLVQWLAIPGIVGIVLGSGSAPTASRIPPVYAMLLASAAAVASVVTSRRTKVGVVMRALPEALPVLRAYRRSTVLSALTLELLVACSGISAGILFSAALPAVSGDSFGGLTGWVLATAVLSASASNVVLAWLLAAVTAAHLGARLAFIHMGLYDVTPLVASMAATGLVGWYALRPARRPIR